MAEKPTKLELQFRHGRQFSDSIPQLFQMLENTTFNPAIHLPKSLSALDESEAVIIFLSRYIIAIVRDFANSPVDYDLILAAYGFLDGYEYTEVKERHVQYCQDIGTHKPGKDTPLNVYWPAGDIDKSLNTKENSAIKKLTKRLENEMIKRGGALGYAAEAEKLLEKPFPLPNYLLENGYRKCEIENRIFYVPLTEKELRSLANQTVKKITSSSFSVETDSNNLSKDVIAEDKRDKISKSDDTGEKDDAKQEESEQKPTITSIPINNEYKCNTSSNSDSNSISNVTNQITIQIVTDENRGSEKLSDESASQKTLELSKTSKPDKLTPKKTVYVPWRHILPTVLFIILFCSFSCVLYHVIVPTSIKKIYVNPGITVNPGEKKDLGLKIYPPEADRRTLKSKIGNDNIVAVTNDWWAVGLDGLEDKEIGITWITIWDGKAEPATLNVVVVKPGNRGNPPVWE